MTVLAHASRGGSRAGVAGCGWDGDPAGDDGDEPLAHVMREVSRELAADATLVAWHGGDPHPLLLFEDGACEPRSTMEQAMIDTAADVAARPAAALARPSWSALDEAGLMTTSIPAGDGVVTITSLFRQIGGSTRPRAREAAARLLPLVQPFFRLWSARLRTQSRLRGLTAAVNKSGVGILLVDEDGRLLFTNAAAESIIAQGDGLRRKAGMLSGLRLADTLRLQAAIEHVVCVRQPAFADGAAPVVALSRQTRRPLLAAIVGSGNAAAAEESAAVIYLFDPEQDGRALLEPACKLYGLSPVETRLTCLLAEGISFADAAERLHVREQTARSYLKQIFQKTRTNRQAELVWLMLKSSVRTAPDCRAQLV